MMQSSRVFNSICECLYKKIVECHKINKKFKLYVVMPLIPGFEGDLSNPAASRSIRVMLHYQFKSICRGPTSLIHRLDESIGTGKWRKYISFCGLRQKGELNNKPITEIIYVHSKMLIVDDKITIIGSANINDRSLSGNRDSEVAIIVEDNQFVDSVMDEKPFKAGVFSSSLRRRCFSEHLGLLDQSDDGNLAGYDPLKHDAGDVDIRDVCSDDFFIEVWLKRAFTNSSVYEEVFRCVPSNLISHSSEIEKFLKDRLIDKDVEKSREKLKEVIGTLVNLPLEFFSKEDLTPEALSVEGVLSMGDTFL